MKKLIIIVMHLALFQAWMPQTSFAQDRAKIDSYKKLSRALNKFKMRESHVSEPEEFVKNWLVSGVAEPKQTYSAATDAEDSVGVRLNRRQLIVQLKPDVSPDNIEALAGTLDGKYGAKIVNAIPEIGVIVVSVADEFSADMQIPAQISSQVTNAQIPSVKSVLSLGDFRKKLLEEPEILLAAPNTLIGVSRIPAPTNGKGRDRGGAVHHWDWKTGVGSPASQKRDGNWGLKFMNFPSAWNFRDAIKKVGQPPLIGILDSGFASHDDVNFKHSPTTTRKRSDHGMHVAGTVFGTWDDGDGIDGCVEIPSANGLVATMDSIPFANVNSPAISLIITDVMSNVVKFIIEHGGTEAANFKDGVKVINLSLGYNWVQNEQRDPNNDLDIQAIVSDHGRLMRTIAELAFERNIIIVSAAGNDSRPGVLPSPILAHWGSPFNWAALHQGDFDTPARNIVVVEAIDRPLADGTISNADFSNVTGCISAPGVNILSTVSHQDPFVPQPTADSKTLAVFSGTSMAAPHITGLVGLMYAYNPELSAEQVLKILDVWDNNRPATQSPAPTVNAFDALVACKATSLNDLSDLNSDGAVNMSDFLIFRSHLKSIEAGDSTVDANGDGQKTNEENNFPRADLNGDGRLDRTSKRMIQGQSRTDLEVMKSVWQDQTVDADDLVDLLD